LTEDAAEQAIFSTLASRGADKSICPSEAARKLAGNPADDSWRGKMPAIRAAAIRLARGGQIAITRKGKPIAPEAIHGVIRLKKLPDAPA
jgi:hypothetical protein